MTVTNQFAAHVGLDWADKKHDVCVQFKNGERVFHVIKHTAEALDVWLTELHQKVKGRIAIAVELKKGPVVYALQKYPFITVFPVHALSLARYRQAFSPSGAKDDPQDAELALELMLRYPQKIKAIEPDNADIRLEANALMATALATQIKVVSEIIKTYDERIEALFDTLPDAGLFKSLPGMGPCMGPRMLAALGDNRGRFNSAEEIQNYAGIAPVTERSGQKSWVHWRWQCAKFVRQTFVEWAAKIVNSSYWARLYY